jgi:rhomboid family GlyGly-CTERM serine protease
LLKLLLAPFVLCLPLALLGLDGQSSLAYQRSAIADGGQYWRLLTAHVVHTNLAHTLLNLAAWPLVFLLGHQVLSAKVWGAVFVLCALGVSAGLWWFSPEVQWYVGLSGVLHGLLVLSAIAAWWHWRPLALAILLGLLAKLCWEQVVGVLPGSTAWIESPVIVDAHLYGAVSGLLFAIVLFSGKRKINLK